MTWDRRLHPGLWFQIFCLTGSLEAAQKETAQHLNLHWMSKVGVTIASLVHQQSLSVWMPCTFIQSRSFHQRERLIFYVYVLYCICYVCLSIIYCIYPCTFAFYPLGGSGVVWSKLQEVLSSVEDSISFRRTWAAPITASDQEKHREHLRAAQENWVKASQV